MKKAKIVFQECIQNAQDYETDEEMLDARIKINFVVEGQSATEMSVALKLPSGGKFENTVLEVEWPKTYKGLMNYQAFRDAVEHYYRDCIGSQGKGIHIAGGSNIIMRNNIMRFPKTVEIEVDEKEFGW
ncbi:hypothetical protein GF340_04145 [Candidatus Peregrinibacteria bacterium]|nr:hypothetical protein [Candidatus Peregrinibacteria bacterium]